MQLFKNLHKIFIFFSTNPLPRMELLYYRGRWTDQWESVSRAGAASTSFREPLVSLPPAGRTEVQQLLPHFSILPVLDKHTHFLSSLFFCCMKPSREDVMFVPLDTKAKIYLCVSKLHVWVCFISGEGVASKSLTYTWRHVGECLCVTSPTCRGSSCRRDYFG